MLALLFLINHLRLSCYLKVADCVCLMSLDKNEAVPIDTHVRQIAVRDYGYVVKSKSLTAQAYKDIGNYM